jgi:hypothetical protein
MYCSLNIIRMIISRRMKWAENKARMFGKRTAVLTGMPAG